MIRSWLPRAAVFTVLVITACCCSGDTSSGSYPKTDRIGAVTGPVTIGPSIGPGIGNKGSRIPGFVIEGQSNAESYGSASGLSVGNASFATTFTGMPFKAQRTVAQDPPTWIYYDGDVIHASGGTANPPSTYANNIGPHFTPGINSDDEGPECSMARKFVTDGTTVKEMIAFTLAGSSLASNWLNASYPTGGPSLQTQEYAYIDASNIQILGVYWNQGENDAKTLSEANAYAANMKTKWDSFFSRYGRHPLIMTQLPTWLTTTPYANRDVVRAQQTLFANSYPWVTIIDESPLTDRGDLTHLDANSQVTIGQQVAAAYEAAVVTTTMTATLLDSTDPVSAGGTAYSYTVNVTNSGSNSAVNVSAVTTLPAGVGFTSASGTGWSCANSSGVVTCTRASGSAGALPTITINVTSPGGAGSGTATATLVSSNVQDLTSLSQTTTFSAPAVTQDSTSHVYIPQSSTEWTNLIALAGLTGVVSVPTSAYYFDTYTGTGTMPDLIGAFPLTLAGSNATFQHTLSGWSSRSIHWINAATANLSTTSASLVDPSAGSVTALIYCQVVSASANRGIISIGTTGGGVQVGLTSTPRVFGEDGSNSTTGTSVPTGAVRFLSVTHNKTAGTARMYSDQEKLAITIGTPSGKKFEFGGSSANALSTPLMDCLYAARWDGSSAEISDANMKTLITTLGNGFWSPP